MPMPMPTYTVFPIKNPVSPTHLAKYKTLRLASLRIDPQAFSSTYAGEAAFSEDVWRERIVSDFKQTFVASVRDDARHISHEDWDGRMDAEETDEWMGMARVIGPTGTAPYLDAFKEAGVGSNWEVYSLNAMWVHPAHRNKGVGTQLVKACLEWARMNVDVKFSSENSRFQKVMVLLVSSDNVAGHALYSRTGFIDLGGVSAGKGEKWMSINV